MKIRVLVLVALCALLVSCGKGNKLAAPKPTPLGNLEAQVRLESVWRTVDANSTSRGSTVFVNLLPALMEDRVIVASTNGSVIAINKQHGQQLWGISVPEGIIAGVGASDSVAVVVSRTGRVLSMKAQSGEILWQYDTIRTIVAPPLVYRDKVILRTIDGDLIGLDSQDGSELWIAEYEQPNFVFFGSPQPVGYDNLAVVGNASGRIIATNLETGFEEWQIFLASRGASGVMDDADLNPVLSERGLFVANLTHAIVAYNLNQGNLMWQNRRPAGRLLTADSTRVYGTDTDGRVIALDILDGSVHWEQPAFLYRDTNNIAVIGDYVIVGDKFGYLHILNRKTGKLAGRLDTNKQFQFDGFMVEDDVFYVAYQSGVVEAFNLRSN